MTDHHDEYWKHPWAVRLSRIVCNDTLTAAPSWHDEARQLVMDIEVQGDGDLLALTRDRAIEAEERLAGLLAVAKEIAASTEPCVICAQTPHRTKCALIAAIAKTASA